MPKQGSDRLILVVGGFLGKVFIKLCLEAGLQVRGVADVWVGRCDEPS
jgi:hypothetical protein